MQACGKPYAACGKPYARTLDGVPFETTDEVSVCIGNPPTMLVALLMESDGAAGAGVAAGASNGMDINYGDNHSWKSIRT